VDAYGEIHLRYVVGVREGGSSSMLLLLLLPLLLPCRAMPCRAQCLLATSRLPTNRSWRLGSAGKRLNTTQAGVAEAILSMATLECNEGYAWLGSLDSHFGLAPLAQPERLRHQALMDAHRLRKRSPAYLTNRKLRKLRRDQNSDLDNGTAWKRGRDGKYKSDSVRQGAPPKKRGRPSQKPASGAGKKKPGNDALVVVCSKCAGSHATRSCSFPKRATGMAASISNLDEFDLSCL
jgi:hypothetical protein